MLLVCIYSYLKSILMYKFFILDTRHTDTVYPGIRMWGSVVIFGSQKGSPSKKKSLRNTDLTHALHLISWKSILILLSHPRLGLQSGFFSSGFPPPKLCMHLSPICATWPAYSILVYCISRMISDEESRQFNSSLCSLLHSPVTSSLLGPNIFLEHPQPMFLPQCERWAG